MLMMETHAAAGAGFCSPNFRWSSAAVSHSAAAFCIRRRRHGRCGVRVKIANGIRASAREDSDSDLGSVKQHAKPQRYHPFEELEPDMMENGEASLTPAETCRTIIEVNSKATLMFSGFVNDEVHENIFWPDLPYVTDERGNIYFQVKNDEDILQTLTTEEIVVQAIIGLDAAEMINEMEALGQSELSFSGDEMDDENSEFDDEDEEDEDGGGGGDEDNYEKDWVAVLDGGNEDDDEESDESVGDWGKLETLSSSHPMDFAKKIAEVASDEPLDFMDQPSAGLAIQGILRPAFIEDPSVVIYKHGDEEKPEYGNLGHSNEEESGEDGEEVEEKDGFSFYKLEMVKIQLVCANGQQTYVDPEDFRRAQPDAIAHSAANIISRVKDGGEKSAQALKSLCWRCKGVQVDEGSLIGVDSLGFDVRVCSATQIQTLRFAFKKRVGASSEYSAERQLNDLLFPRAHKHHQKKEARPTES
ncbi:hypothetical protein M569_01143 [Genlisea aurea]|uniref:Uncharacterized protein n=1 Tax=Genlisea aurea TaxID=192259 RepID=S8D1F9_9LAMI|nr:hypothetical protein M569_01143 [Genlisea aurea]